MTALERGDPVDRPVDSNIEHLRAEIASLERALESSRRIGAAVGILMAVHKLSAEDAFTMLSRASQDRNRKVRDLAEDVLYAGDLLP